ncbi:MAG: transcriptional repressor [Rubellimicrobium sp.]|nr:transcriptional repressor [Rubellimicrobium sp.]
MPPHDPSQHAQAFGAHDHGHCVSTAMSSAERICARDGLQFTPVRRRVLEILLEAHEAMGAYDILARLEAEGLGSKPPIAYRALAFLVENGFVHRIERLNKFIACSHPGDQHAPAFMICRICGAIAEGEVAPGGPLAASAARSGFRVERTVIEVEGLCPACQQQEPAT